MQGVLLFLLLLLVGFARCSTLYVNSASGINQGACRNSQVPCQTLDYAVSEASPDDEIMAVGLFMLKSPVKVTKAVMISPMTGFDLFNIECTASSSNALQITASNVMISRVNIRSCSASAVTVTNAAANVVLDNVTVSGLGGALSVSGGAATSALLRNSRVMNARSDGVVCNSGSLLVESCVFAQDEVQVMQGVGLRVTGQCRATTNAVQFVDLVSKLDGAAMLVNQQSSLVGSRITVSGCRSESNGGALAVLEASFANLTDVQLTFCDAASGGGALFASTNSVVHLNEAKLAQNSATVGGAVFLENVVQLHLSSATLSENNAQTAGGAVYMQAVLQQKPEIVMEHVLINNNHVGLGGSGGSFSCVGGNLAGSNVELFNNTVVDQGQGAGGFLSQGCAAAFTELMIEGNRFQGGGLEGIVCQNGAQADVAGMLLTEEGVICEPGCNLAINGDQDICVTQPRGPASYQRSLIDNVGVVVVEVNTAANVPVVARDFYNRKLNTLETLNWKLLIKNEQGLTINTLPQIVNSAAGEYRVSFTLGTVGDYHLLVDLDEQPIKGSPASVQIKDSSQKPSAPDLTALWVVLGLVVTGGIVIVTIMGYKKFAKRSEYKPLADNNTAMGFESSTDYE